MRPRNASALHHCTLRLKPSSTLIRARSKKCHFFWPHKLFCKIITTPRLLRSLSKGHRRFQIISSTEACIRACVFLLHNVCFSRGKKACISGTPAKSKELPGPQKFARVLNPQREALAINGNRDLVVAITFLMPVFAHCMAKHLLLTTMKRKSHQTSLWTNLRRKLLP